MKIRRWHGLVVWAIGSLWAIAVVGDALMAGMVIAVASGVAFGIVNWRATAKSKDDAV